MQISKEEAHRIIQRLPAGGGESRGEDGHRSRGFDGHGESEFLRFLMDLPEVRMEKVLRLRTAIMERRYSVPAEQVAEKILFRALADRMV